MRRSEVFGELVAQHQDRTVGVGENGVRDGAEEQAVKRALAVRAHHDHVGRKLVAGGNNGLDGRADAVVERHAGGKRAAAVNDGVEDGLRLLAVELVKGVRSVAKRMRSEAGSCA